MTPSTDGVPSSFSFSHIISGSVPARRWRPVASSKSCLLTDEVAAAIGGQERARVLTLLAVSEALAPDARELLAVAGRPWEHLEGLGLRDADELRGLGPVADVVPVAVGEEVRGGAVDELEALVRDRLPVGSGDAFPHDPPRDRGELVVDVADVLGVDLLADLLDVLGLSFGFDERSRSVVARLPLGREPVRGYVMRAAAAPGEKWEDGLAQIELAGEEVLVDLAVLADRLADVPGIDILGGVDAPATSCAARYEPITSGSTPSSSTGSAVSTGYPASTSIRPTRSSRSRSASTGESTKSGLSGRHSHSHSCRSEARFDQAGRRSPRRRALKHAPATFTRAREGAGPGVGRREHALAWKLAQSERLSELHAAPGNPGIAALGRCHPIRIDDVEGLLGLCREHEPDLVVVGPEAPLVAGIADALRRAGFAVFGPSKAAARIEGSKAFAKEVMEAAAVPTAADLDEARAPCVVKADGLAAGKGVFVCRTQDEADAALGAPARRRGRRRRGAARGRGGLALRAHRRPEPSPSRPRRTSSGCRTATRARTPAAWGATRRCRCSTRKTSRSSPAWSTAR